jgi:hypothetical protein
VELGTPRKIAENAKKKILLARKGMSNKNWVKMVRMNFRQFGLRHLGDDSGHIQAFISRVLCWLTAVRMGLFRFVLNKLYALEVPPRART